MVLEWKTVFSCVRPNAYISQSKEQDLNRLTQPSHYAKPEYDLTHPKDIYLSVSLGRIRIFNFEELNIVLSFKAR